MSIKIMAEVWDNTAGLSAGEVLFLLALADRAADDHRCAWPGVRVLQDRAHASRATVYRYVETLQEACIIERCPEDEIPEQYSRKGGRETIVWRFRPTSDWRVATDPYQEGSQDETGLTSDTPGVSSVRPEPPTTKLSRKSNSQTASGSRSSRRAKRARADRDEGWTDPAAEVFAEQQDDTVDIRVPEPKSMRRSPDSAWGLNGYYRQKVFIAGTGRVGNTNDGAMRRFFAEAKRCKVAPATLRLMVDCFVDDPQLFDRVKKHRWKTFIANAPKLQERAERVLSAAQFMDPSEELPAAQYFGGAIPQSVLDEILKDAS